MLSIALVILSTFLLTAVPGKRAIEWLRGMGARQTVSQDAPSAHSVKQGTPTMGGIMFLIPFVLVSCAIIAWSGMARTEPALLPVFLLTISFALIGFADDFLSMLRGKNLGLTAPQKFAAQCLVAIGFVFWLGRTAQPIATQVQWAPSAILTPPLDLGPAYYLTAVLFLVGLSNATNITDGLDGLAGGVTFLICVAAAALTWMSHPGLSLLTMALAGGLLGFLWWNAHPAKVFMGDTGSLPIGALLAGVALAGKQEVGIILASLLCWAELVSVIVQVTVFKLRRRSKGLEYAKANRVFLRTPLHHHFEEMKVPETAIVSRFWVAGAVLVVIALLWGRIV